MRTLKTAVLVGMLSLVACRANATSYYPVSGESIQSYIDIASDGDSIICGPGEYDGFEIDHKSLVVTSSGAAESTTIHGGTSGTVIKITSSESATVLISDLTLHGGDNGVQAKGGVLILHSCIISENLESGALVEDCESGTTVTNCRFSRLEAVDDNLNAHWALEILGVEDVLVMGNTFTGLYWAAIRALPSFWDWSPTTGDIRNNTIRGVIGSGMYSVKPTFRVYGNIFADLGGPALGVTAYDYSNVFYNCIWNETKDCFQVVNLSEDNIYEDPLFDPNASDIFTLRRSSPCVDAGDPGTEFDDPDGTRADIGANMVVLSRPETRGFRLNGNSRTRVYDQPFAFVWSPRCKLGQQQQYEIEVNTEDDWSRDVLWSSGSVFTQDTVGSYGGPALARGETYFARIRIADQTGWGIWSTLPLLVNCVAGPPICDFPLLENTIHPRQLILSASPEADPDGDSLLTDFEIYSDESLTNQVYSQLFLDVDCAGTAYTDLIASLQPRSDYWWRARAFDGFEYTEWTAPVHFYVRGAGQLLVPEEYDSIEAAAEVAYANDTILVGPGEYRCKVMIARPGVKIISSAGPTQTVISPEVSNHPAFFFHLFGQMVVETDTTIVRGFTFTGTMSSGYPILQIYGGVNYIVEDNMFTGVDGGSSISTSSLSEAIIRHNIFVDCDSTRTAIRYAKSCTIENNTFCRIGRAIAEEQESPYPAEAVRNNIFSDCYKGVFYGTVQVAAEYNLFYNNGEDFPDGYVPGEGNIFEDPLFVDAEAGDFRLQAESPCINAGNPDPAYNDHDGSRNDIGAFPYDGPTAVEGDNAALPRRFSLAQNYPNPFNPSTVIAFSVPRKTDVKLEIYNVLGQTVRTLLACPLTAGDYTVTWNGDDNSGASAATGVYFYRIRTAENEATRKMILLR
jgi:hypothetical protein